MSHLRYRKLRLAPRCHDADIGHTALHAPHTSHGLDPWHLTPSYDWLLAFSLEMLWASGAESGLWHGGPDMGGRAARRYTGAARLALLICSSQYPALTPPLLAWR